MLYSTPSQHGSRRTHEAQRTPTVCVVDPHASDYRGWQAMAEVAGVRLDFVASAEAALRLARSQAVDLWVIKAELPGLRGTELCGMLKTQYPQIAVYVVAESHTPELERAAWAARASMFGCKGEHTEWLELWLEHKHATSSESTSAATLI